MGGFHWFDLLVILGTGLLIFGPKTLQSMARNAGKGVNQAKNMKNAVLSELPKEVTQITQQISRVPMSPQQAVQMLMATEKEQKSEERKPVEDTSRPL